MDRRNFCLSSLAIAAARPALAGFAPLPQARWEGTRLLFLDAATIAEQTAVQLLPPPLEKVGPLIRPDSPGDGRGVIGAMGNGLLRDEKGRLRYYYSGHTAEEPRGAICVAESVDGRVWTKPDLGQASIGGARTNRLSIEGVPEGAHTTQPSVVRLPDGRFRMYFWAHIYKPQRQGRYVAADSEDGLHFKVRNLENPCLRHPWDMGKWGWLDGPESRKRWPESGAADENAARALKRVRSNDAVHTYADPAGGYEMFSVWVLPNAENSGRYIRHDNAHFALRVISRRTSQDGLVWSDPEFLVAPDEKDAWDQQFYYLAQHRLGPLRIGFLGNYRVWDQTIDIEMAYSRDGRQWHRPLRGAWLPRGPQGSLDSTLIYMPSHLIDQGDHWLGLYTACDAPHNKYWSGQHTIHGVRIPRYRFAGLGSSGSLTARIRTAPFFLGGPRLQLDAAIRGSLRAELCDAFGRPFPGFRFAESVPVAGDNAAHELRWNGADSLDYQTYAVTLRLEWTDGMVYGAHTT